jgi:hypothetical protein
MAYTVLPGGAPVSAPTIADRYVPRGVALTIARRVMAP